MSNTGDLEAFAFTVSAKSGKKRRAPLWPDLRPSPSWADEATIAQRKREAHQRRVEQAGVLHQGIIWLDPAACTFGPRRVTLAGTLRESTPQRAVEAAFHALRWALMTLYLWDDEKDGRRIRLDDIPLRDTRLTIRATTAKNAPPA